MNQEINIKVWWPNATLFYFIGFFMHSKKLNIKVWWPNATLFYFNGFFMHSKKLNIKVWWPNATLFYFIGFFMHSIQIYILTSIDIRRGSSPFIIIATAQWQSRDSNSGPRCTL